MTCPCGSTLPVTSVLYALGIELAECRACAGLGLEVEGAIDAPFMSSERDTRETELMEVER